MNLRIVITGASGFIGTNLLEKFVNEGHFVLNIDYSNPLNKNYNNFFKKIDITNFNDLKIAITKFNPDYIIHLAARTDLNGKTITDYSANTVGVNNILEVSKKLKNLKKIIISSSMLVCSLGYKPINIFDYHPTTIYGESKVITEQIVWNNKPNCDWAIIRPTSIWGEWFGEPYKNFFDMIIKKHYFHIGKKSCTKTYGYIGNAIYQIERILFSDTSDEKNKIFYIGDIPPINIEEWANEIAAFLDYKILTVPYSIVYIAAKLGDILKKLGIPFPMTTFRFHNMTTDNIIDLTNINTIAPNLPYTRTQGIQKTLEWINSNI
jgi:nucleoside-diphosphate-sugar epimerase